MPDLRNSRVPDIVAELAAFGIEPLVHDPIGDPEEAFQEYGVRLAAWDELTDLDAMICAVSHDFYTNLPPNELFARVRDGGVLVDVKSAFDPGEMPRSIKYWSL